MRFFRDGRAAAGVAIAWVSAVMALTSSPASAASFDCAKASAPHERAVCADGPLSAADEELASLYRQLLARPDLAGAPADRLRQDQRAWIADTRDCGAALACLEPLYRTRIEALRALSRTGPTPAGARPPETAALVTFLRTYLGEPNLSADPTAEIPVTVAWKDLNGDRRPEAVAYLQGPWCGSGGCTLLVLESVGGSFVVRGRTTVVRLPVARLKSTTRGWSDLLVTVGGGGERHGQVILPFQGARYPGNATIAPARRAESHSAAEVVLRDR